MATILHPIGTVVHVNGVDNPIMIFGVYQQDNVSGKSYDYFGVPYPHGYLGGDSTLLFNTDDIAEVIYRGYVTLEYTKLMTDAAVRIAEIDAVESEMREAAENARDIDLDAMSAELKSNTSF